MSLHRVALYISQLESAGFTQTIVDCYKNLFIESGMERSKGSVTRKIAL